LSDEQEARYKVVFLGPVQNDLANVNKLAEGLKDRFKLDDEAVTRMMRMAPVAIKKDATFSEAQKYKGVLEAIGARVQLEPIEEVLEEPQQIVASLPPLDREPQVVPGNEETAPSSPEAAPPQREEPQATEEGLSPLDREPQIIPVKAKTPPPPAESSVSSKTGAAAGSNMVTCPQCGYVQEQTDECFKCGVIISKFLKYMQEVKPVEGEGVPPGAASSPAAEGPQPQRIVGIPIEEPTGSTPWEDMASLGFFTAFFRTIKEVLFAPTAFFRRMPVSQGIPPPLFYGVIVSFLAATIGMLVQYTLLGSMGSFTGGGGMEGMGGGHVFQAAVLIIYAFFLPILIAIGLFITSGIFHLCLLIVGAGKRGFEATFRVAAYTCSTQVFSLVPFIGPLILFFYTLVVYVIGFRESHRTTTGRALIAVLLPILIIGFFITLLVVAIVIPLILSQGRGLMEQQPPTF